MISMGEVRRALSAIKPEVESSESNGECLIASRQSLGQDWSTAHCDDNSHGNSLVKRKQMFNLAR
jgi:hypothetical protein